VILGDRAGTQRQRGSGARGRVVGGVGTEMLNIEALRSLLAGGRPMP